MNRSIIKNAFAAVSFAAAMAAGTSAYAADSDVKTLNDAIGATDSFNINCSGPSTDHLNLKLIDSTPVLANPVAPQLLNIHISKGNKKIGFITADADAIAPGEKEELELPGGNGPYKVSVDTLGTNLDILQKQTFSVEYSCLNATDEITRPSSPRVKFKKVKNNKISKFAVGCGKSKTTGDTAKLYLKITNTTVDPSKIVLNAQVFKGDVASNASDINGDSFYSDDINVPGGSGTYTVLVDSTAFNDAQDNSRQYSFQYNCLNALNEDTGTPPSPTVTQDQ